MPVCRKCGNSFPNSIKIDGKTHIIHNRKYCLDCSPFGKHNTKILDEKTQNRRKLTSLKVANTTILTCTNCGRVYDYSTKRGHTLTICNSCAANKKKRAAKNKAVEYKGGRCEFCGYNKCTRALVFHHKDPSKKDFGIGGSHCRTWESMKEELDKCLLLCANCHAELHEKLDDEVLKLKQTKNLTT